MAFGITASKWAIKFVNTMDKLAKIKHLTSYTLSDIMLMDDVVFFREITSLMVKGTITPFQHNWLYEQREESNKLATLNLVWREK